MISLLSGNSRILLTVDERGQWTELYYPRPGQDQQLEQARLGLYDEADGAFCWVDQEGEDPYEKGYIEGSNAARTRMRRMGLDLTVDDMVHPDMDLIIRRVVVQNPGETARKMRLFHYQSLTIGGSLYQGTSYWDDAHRTINHYKGHTHFQFWGRPDFDHFTNGEHTLKGLRGSYVDAEDGELEGNPISHGAADSVVQWDIEVPPQERRTVHLFVMAAGSRAEINDFYHGLQGRDPALYTDETVGFWNHWAENMPLDKAAALSPRARDVYRRGLFVMRDCASHDGAIIASPDSRTLRSGGDTYNYCWWRDSALISRVMSETGMERNVRAYLQFARDSQEEEGYFLHRHFPDGSVGSTWHPPPFIQIDQTASVIDAVHHDYVCTGNLDELLENWDMVRRAADFLMEFTDDRGLPLPSFDLWEERKSVNSYAVGTVVKGLEAAAEIGKALAKRSDYWAQTAETMRGAAWDHLWNEQTDTLHKSIDPEDPTIDASTLLAPLFPPEDPRYRRVVEAIENRLWVPHIGGIARYEGDTYYGRENPWIICTLWLARARLELGDHERCRELIEWAAAQAGPADLLPEQIDRETGEHTSVTPLVWSHSTFIETVHAYQRAVTGPRTVAPRAVTGGTR